MPFKPRKKASLPLGSKLCIRKSICTGEESLVCETEGAILELGSYKNAKERDKLLKEYGVTYGELEIKY